VALPLCLGIALASGAPAISGLVSGIVGGVVVGALGGSHTSVSGPAAGLAAIVLAQLLALGSLESLLLAVFVAGLIQLALGVARAGMLALFVPTSVIKGLLAAVGVLLVLKQIPHVLGRDTDPQGEMAFVQPDHENTFSELLAVFGDLHWGAAAIGLLSIAVLVGWMRVDKLRSSRISASLVVVLLGLGLAAAFEGLGATWAISSGHLVQVPASGDLTGLMGSLPSPDFSQWQNPAIYRAAATIAVVASIESLLSLEAVDKLDPQQRVSPPDRELWAQGAGNMACGLLGGIPITAVVVRGSVNVQAGAVSKASTIFHGVLLAAAVVLLPQIINRIPLSCLAAILLVTGVRLASPALVRRMWDGGRDQFVPFAATVLAIVFTDLLIGLGIGMAVSLAFILRRQSRRPLRRISEKHVEGHVLHIELPDQVSFLNHMAIQRLLDEVPRGAHVLLDAQRSEYLDPDVLALLREYRDVTAPARGVHLSMVGFDEIPEFKDEILFIDYSTREQQDRMTPGQVLEILRKGNERFASGRRINRDLARQVSATAAGQFPLAVVLSCIDSRAPAELLFDMGVGDIFSARVAGNVLSPKVLGSMEYGCAVAGSRLIVVMGHTRCGAVTAAVEYAGAPDSVAEATGCQHLLPILSEIHRAVDLRETEGLADLSPEGKVKLVDQVARLNVLAVVEQIVEQSDTIARLVKERRIAIVGVLYDVVTGTMDFMVDHAIGLEVTATEGRPRSPSARRG
jgi:carbonic anhydrase/SulP family sulfate permease